MLNEKRIKLIRKTIFANEILFLKFHHNLNFYLNSCFFIIIKAKIKKKKIYRPYYPIDIRKNKMVLILNFQKKGKMSKILKNTPINAQFFVVRIIKLFNLKKNMKKRIGIIVGEIDIPSIWQILKFFSKMNHRTQLKIIYTNFSRTKISIFDQIKKKVCENVNFEFKFILEKSNDFLNYKISNNVKEKIGNHLGNPEVGKSIFICGFLNLDFFVFELLYKLGFSKESVIKF